MRLGINGRFYAARRTGVQRVAHELCAQLYGAADTVLMLPGDASAPDRVADRAAVVQGRLTGHAWEQLELPRLARAAGCTLVLNPANSLPFVGGPHVVMVHDVLPLTHPQWFNPNYVLWHRHVVRGAIQRAAVVLTSSKWSANEIARVCGVHRSRIALVVQGVEPFSGPADLAWTQRVTAGFGLDAPFLLCVGADPRKNVEFLYPVVAELRRTASPDLLLVVVGTLQQQVHAAPAEAETPPFVRQIPDLNDEELRALYTAAAVLCSPSFAEGYGRPPLEAMACGTPAVVADYGPAREILGDSAHILPLDPDSWVTTLRALLESPPSRERRAQRSKAIEARFNWLTAAAEVLGACRLVASGNRAQVRR